MSKYKSNVSDDEKRQQFDALKTSEERQEWLFKEVQETNSAFRLISLALIIYMVFMVITQLIGIFS